MIYKRVFPKSVQPGIPKLSTCPDGWVTYRFRDLLKIVSRPAKLLNDETYTLVTAKRSRGGIIQRANLRGRDIKVKTQFYIKKDDFLISRRQIVHGGCGVVPKNLDSAIVSNEYLVLHAIDELKQEYLKWLSHTIYFQQTCFHASIGVHVEKMVFKPDWWLKFKVNIPSIKEQEKINAILETWENIDSKIEKLIIKKKLFKKHLMQRLLTGKIRLKGFKKERWKKIKLGDVFKERIEKDYDHLPLLAITGDKGVISRDNLDRDDTSSEDKSTYKRICPGDIGYNTMRMWQGVSGVSKMEGIVSPAYTIVTPKKNIYPDYMGYLFKLPSIIYMFYRYSQGLVSDTWNLKYKHFKLIHVDIPESIEEQKQIVLYLQSIDREINLLIKKRGALKEQKKGLMQQLLTGKIRVNV